MATILPTIFWKKISGEKMIVFRFEVHVNLFLGF